MRTLPPSLSELTARRIASQPHDSVSDGDAIVEPYDAGSGFRTDAKTAFADAAVVVRLLTGEAPTTPPGGWEAYVRSRPLRSVVVMRAGNYPQLCDLKTQSFASNAGPFSSVEREMLASTATKLAGGEQKQPAPDFVTNETACRLFDEGRLAEAVALWETLTIVGIRNFNLGVVALLRNDRDRAALSFQQAAETLPPTSGWVELALAYRACCDKAN